MRLKLLELVRAIGLVDLQEVHRYIQATQEEYMPLSLKQPQTTPLNPLDRWLFDEGIVSLLMDLFERYDHNNLLHSLVIGALRSLVSLDDPTLVCKRQLVALTAFSQGKTPATQPFPVPPHTSHHPHRTP